MDWSDEGLEQRVAGGEASLQHVAYVKGEMPSPRTVGVAPADIVFQDGLDIELGVGTLRALSRRRRPRCTTPFSDSTPERYVEGRRASVFSRSDIEGLVAKI